MPVVSNEFWGVIFFYVVALVIPIALAIMYLNDKYQSKRMLQVIAAIVMYVVLFLSWYVIIEPLSERFQMTGLFASILMSLMFVFIALKVFLKVVAPRFKSTGQK